MASNPLDGKTKGEQDFLVEYSRRRLVTWAAQEQTAQTLGDQGTIWQKVAFHKGWLRKDGTGLTSAGYKTAAAFLRR